MAGSLASRLKRRLLDRLEPHLVGFVLRHYEAPAERLARLQTLTAVRDRLDHAGFWRKPDLAGMRERYRYALDRLQWEFGGGAGAPTDAWLALPPERRPLAAGVRRRRPTDGKDRSND